MDIDRVKQEVTIEKINCEQWEILSESPQFYVHLFPLRAIATQHLRKRDRNSEVVTAGILCRVESFISNICTN